MRAEPLMVRRQQSTVKIDCHRAVTHQIINYFINRDNRCEQRCNSCRNMMQKVRLIVTEMEEWCRTNVEITCYGEHFTLVFCSGNRKDKVVVQTIQGRVYVTVTEESWRRWWKNRAIELAKSLEVIVRFVVDNFGVIGPPFIELLQLAYR